jgi:hypothetical protein
MEAARAYHRERRPEGEDHAVRPPRSQRGLRTRHRPSRRRGGESPAGILAQESLSGQSTGRLEPGGYEPHLCEASRIFASYSFATEYPVERYFRDARFLLWGGGTSEILRVIIGRDLDRPPSLG